MKKLRKKGKFEKKVFNLQKFAFNPESFVEGSVSTVAQTFTVEFDFDKMGEWTEVCLTSYTESPNLQTETMSEICNNGFTSTFVKGFDPQFDFEGIIHKGSPLGQLMSQRYVINFISDIPLRVTNSILDEQLITSITITTLTNGGAAADIYKVSFSGKPFSGEPQIISPIVDFPESMQPPTNIVQSTGALSSLDATVAEEISGTYDYTANDELPSLAKIQLFETANMSAVIEEVTPLVEGVAVAYSFATLTTGTNYTVKLLQGTRMIATETTTAT